MYCDPNCAQMLPSFAHLNFNHSNEDDDNLSSSNESSGDFTWFMPHYRVIGRVKLPPKTAPHSKSLVVYKMVECPYCHDSIHVKAEHFESQMGKRVQDHLTECKNYHWHVQGLRRSRKRSQQRKPFNDHKPYSQLIINESGKLERHKLGSLIRCCANGLERGYRGAAQRITSVPITKARLESGDFWTDGGWIPNVGE